MLQVSYGIQGKSLMPPEREREKEASACIRRHQAFALLPILMPPNTRGRVSLYLYVQLKQNGWKGPWWRTQAKAAKAAAKKSTPTQRNSGPSFGHCMKEQVELAAELAAAEAEAGPRPE
jgi:hypothetical protein